jgi:predicted amidohydrolase
MVSLLDTEIDSILRCAPVCCPNCGREDAELTDSSTRPMRLAVSQFAPRQGDIQHNIARIRGKISRSSAELLIFPELAATGYDVRDRVHELAMDAATLAQLVPSSADRAAVLGFIERGPAGLPFNAAALLTGGRAGFIHRKLYLPTYGMFDEGRYFGRGRVVEHCTLQGWRIGILICEDFWHPALSYLLACQQIDLLLVLAAAPGRGVTANASERPFASSEVWERMARTTAQLHGIYVVLCNRVGVEGAVTFAGDSLVSGPTGEVLAAARHLDEDELELTIEPAELARARRPYAHIRDEEPQIVLHELQRILAAHV